MTFDSVPPRNPPLDKQFQVTGASGLCVGLLEMTVNDPLEGNIRSHSQVCLHLLVRASKLDTISKESLGVKSPTLSNSA